MSVVQLHYAPGGHIMKLSNTGEVAEFLDDNQFGTGESTEKCGPESIALCFHSVAPGQHNPYTREEIHSMAHNDYMNIAHQKDVRNIGEGINDPEFYKMIESHGIPYRKLPHDWSIIVEWLQHGYPVIIGGVREDTIHDAELNGKPPYDWGGLDKKWHIITATGLGSRADRLKFRDTANGRPGPHEYFHERMSYTLATLVVPKWMPTPPPGAVRPPTPIFSNDLCVEVYSSYFKSIGKPPPPRDTDIFNDWRDHWIHGDFKGCCLSAEYKVTLDNGDPGVAQNFAGGTCVFNNKTKSATWL
jgi:hypothetical protein